MQIMGKEIVRCEYPGSRLWTYKDVCLALMDNTGKEKIEAIFLDMPGIKEAQWNMKAFSKISRLRLLKIDNVQLSEGPDDLSNKLGFLEWHSYPSKSLPAGLQVDELVELHMANSSLEQLWYGCIEELSSSIHHLIGLEVLSMKTCKNLKSIPSSIGCLKSLKKLDLFGCSELENIPENLGKVESLEEFDVSGTSIRQPPASIFLLKNLKVLSFDGCKRIAESLTDQRLPALSGMCSLKVLDLCACNLREGALPEDIGCLSSLKSLDLSRNNFVSLPKSINQLSGLEMLALEDCTMLESLPEVPSRVQTVYLNGCISLKEIPDLIKLSSSKRSEFICLNCWELYNHNGQDNMGLTMLERYLKGLSNPRPGFGIVVPGNEIPGWFNHQSMGSSISVQVPSFSMGFVACVAFSANGESPSLFCHLKVDGRENYPLPMCISYNYIQVLSNHIWLFYLSFDRLKELKEWKHESFSNIELTFHSFQPGVKVKNCGVCLLSSVYITTQPSSAHFIVTSKEAASSFKASLAFSSSYHQWKANVFPSNVVTYLKSDLALRFIVPAEKEPEKVMAIRSRLFKAIEESGLSIVIFSRDCAYLPWCFEELVKIVEFMDEMRSNTVFPVSYDVEQSKIDDQIENCTIVFDKNEENLRENEEKVQRWMDILSEAEILSGSKSLTIHKMQLMLEEQQGHQQWFDEELW
ncbi:hypothetical protein POTOM_055171 [Populus tomentosa]|uniref:TIR domain-containing protein n=1 Tax=Populus tomentosa TaxID=118781 RepID=A0A8X8BYZ7_POPTO|nr:hypothetical protein POTOM_055171 [Populus tomentosa]